MPHAAAISGRTVIIHVLTVVLASAALCSAGAQDAPARPPLVGAEWVHTVVAGESWTTLGAREGITPAVLAARNERTLKSPLRAGDIIVIDNRHNVPDAVFARDSSGTGQPQQRAPALQQGLQVVCQAVIVVVSVHGVMWEVALMVIGGSRGVWRMDRLCQR